MKQVSGNAKPSVKGFSKKDAQELYFRAHAFRFMRLQGCKVTGLQGYKGTGLQGYRVARLQGYRVARLWLNSGEQWGKCLFLLGLSVLRLFQAIVLLFIISIKYLFSGTTTQNLKVFTTL